MKLIDPPGATPLSPEDLEGLIPEHIATRGELDAWEAQNILEATAWLRDKRASEVLDDGFARQLHKRMFDQTWAWAGKYRQREANIGADPRQIPVLVRQLFDNYRHQRDAGGLPPEQLAARFHRDLVWIHPFANGNGRHARVMADLLMQQQGHAPFTWGSADLARTGPARERYLAALRDADRGDYKTLEDFVGT